MQPSFSFVLLPSKLHNEGTKSLKIWQCLTSQELFHIFLSFNQTVSVKLSSFPCVSDAVPPVSSSCQSTNRNMTKLRKLLKLFSHQTKPCVFIFSAQEIQTNLQDDKCRQPGVLLVRSCGWITVCFQVLSLLMDKCIQHPLMHCSCVNPSHMTLLSALLCYIAERSSYLKGWVLGKTAPEDLNFMFFQPLTLNAIYFLLC